LIVVADATADPVEIVVQMKLVTSVNF
jgi:hypothetical protein